MNANAQIYPTQHEVTRPTPAVVSALRSSWSAGRRVERIGYTIGALLLASGLIHLALLLIDGGSWEGPRSLRKAVTFGLSFGLTTLTIIWVSTFLRLSERVRVWLLSVFTAACVLETYLVSLQAWRGVPSHFNFETPFDAGVTRLLAVGGITLVLILFALTFISFRRNVAVSLSLRLAVRVGFVALCGALISGGLMIARGTQLVVAGNREAAYATGGALKPMHGALMHGILVLPLLAWLLSFSPWSERRQLMTVTAAATTYLIVAGAVAAANLIGVVG